MVQKKASTREDLFWGSIYMKDKKRQNSSMTFEVSVVDLSGSELEEAQEVLLRDWEGSVS